MTQTKTTPTNKTFLSMEEESEISSELLPFVRIYKSGHIERISGTEIIPPSLDPINSVITKDIIYSQEHNLSVRLFLPTKPISDNNNNNKLPLLIYVHGGAWIIESPFSPIYHNYLTEVVKSANCLAVSIQYRRAPENPIPAAYEDVWSAIQWIYKSNESDWINEYADFTKVYLAGDSAGANMSHHMAMKAGEDDEGKLGIRFKGIMIIHPAFWGRDPIDEDDVQDREIRNGIAEVWERIASPNSVNGTDDPLFNVNGSGSDFSRLGCEKVLVAVARGDVFVRQGLGYAEKVKKSGWEGEVEVVVEEGEGHVFHLQNPNSDKALKFLKKFVEFITC